MQESNFFKISVAVPVGVADKMREAMGSAGAGRQGNYDFCSGSYKQTGRFRPLKGANPTIGEVGKLEEVEEEVIEAICHKDLVGNLVAAIIKAHPYEEPAIDIFPRLEL